MTAGDGVALVIRLAALVTWALAFTYGIRIEPIGVRSLIGLIILMSLALVLGGFATIGALPADLSRAVYTAVATASAIIGIGFIVEARRAVR